MVLLFQRSTCSHTFEWYRHYFRRSLAVIYYFQEYCVSLKQALVVIPFFKGIELIRNSSCSHPFDEWLFFYKINCCLSFFQIYCVSIYYITFTVYLYTISNLLCIYILYQIYCVSISIY